ncbi:Hypothetical predicted protein [Paramuricea clavata]|uniref:DUF5641 domain-containing protein n=1 Tax=Paramuricea clavata TaxID=317549 RepID=A0A6S7IKI3_PARCT|nr:Hypothetical predicted protein [Paramuricea clavata]
MNRISENEAQLLADCNDEQDTLQTSEGINQGESRSSQTLRMEHDQSYTRETTGNLSEPVEKCEQKILGVKWNYQEDCFVFDLGPIAQAAKECEPTKRNIISIASKFYDPLGFISPIIEKVLARQLHGFCDASISAYAAVVYLVVTTTTRRYATFVTAKTRVAPSQKQTIPRLELLSAVILGRLMKNTYEALKSVLELDENVVCWTDSLAKWTPWLSEELQPNDKLIDEPSPSKECLRELKKKPHHSPTALVAEATGQGIKELMNIATFSNYHRLLRVTVYVLRFVRKLKANVKRRADKSRERLKNSWLEEINEAETLWLKEMQTSLPEHLKYQDWRRQFGIFVDEKGVTRCGGRLENANINKSAKHPILLDPRHQLTRLIVRYCHERDIAKRERHLASLLDHFWRRWKTEYLLESREAHRERKSVQSSKELIKINDIVIVHDENRSRSLWRLGRVMHLVRGNDGKVRGAKVKVAERGKKPTTLRRPIQKLYSIEIGNQDITQQKVGRGSTTIQPQKEESITQRPRRAAAIKATEKRRELIRNEQL